MRDSATQVCTDCGEYHPGNVRFCPNCGNPFAGRAAIDPSGETPAGLSPQMRPAQGTAGARKFGLLAAFVVVLIIAIAVLNRAHQTRTSTRGAAQPSAPVAGGGPISTRASRVPFVGCKSDGQSGPVEAPNGEGRVVEIDAEAAQQLAYYRSVSENGVLAPRGWYCFGMYGSGGTTLYVSPQPINIVNLSSTAWSGFAGPVIQLSWEDAGASGRFGVAETIARVFPAHWAFVREIIEEGIEPAGSFPLGPYPDDKLIYKSNEIVEYQTPAHAEGLGTNSSLQSDATPISGVAILTAPRARYTWHTSVIGKSSLKTKSILHHRLFSRLSVMRQAGRKARFQGEPLRIRLSGSGALPPPSRATSDAQMSPAVTESNGNPPASTASPAGAPPSDLPVVVTHEAISVDSTDFLAAYQIDEGTANVLYKNKKVAVTGVLSGVFLPSLNVCL